MITIEIKIDENSTIEDKIAAVNLLLSQITENFTATRGRIEDKHGYSVDLPLQANENWYASSMDC